MWIVLKNTDRIISLILPLLLISFILFTTSINHAQAYPNPCEGGSCDPATPPPITPQHGEPTANNTSMLEGNNTVNVKQESNNTDITQ